MNLRLVMRLVITGALLTILVPGATVAATPPAATYHGIWTGAGDVCGTHPEMGGIWNVNLRNDGTAAVDVRISADGRPDAAWGGNYFHQAWVQGMSGADVFALANGYGYGMSLALAPDGALTFVIKDFCVLVGAGPGDLTIHGQLIH